MYAVIGVWVADPAQAEQQDEGLRSEVVPLVRSLPGFVRGLWTDEDDSGRSHTNLVFDSEEHARDFVAFMRSERVARAEEVGITLVGDFAIAPVVAEA